MEENRIAKLLSQQGIPRLHTTLGAVLFLAWPAVVEQNQRKDE